ncbi:SIR2 family protein [Vibrio fluvialis]|nr:SIR2 family protein [Vibrio fluvialis]
MNKLPPPSPPSIMKGEAAVRYPNSEYWHPLNESTYMRIRGIQKLSDEDKAEINDKKNMLSSRLQQALQLPNLSFFAGSGTSLGKPKGPRMWDLWVKSMFIGGIDNQLGDNESQLTSEAKSICEKVRYNELKEPNIEHFLSACDAYQAVFSDEEVGKFIDQVKSNVLSQCSDFLELPDSDISTYTELLRKLAKRRTRDPRLKIFTTNYDMCFENASADLGMMIVDGFSYTRKRRFDGKYFNYDVVDRNKDEQSFIQGVFQLFKLHGSVSWERKSNDILETLKPSPETACLVYPAKGKYQQAFIQPHLELLSRFLEYLRQPNCCLVISGFGFNDDHLSEPILAAVKSNPSFKLIISDYSACDHIYFMNNYWEQLSELSLNGADITFINASFDDMVSLIPNLAALSPAEQLAESILAYNKGQSVHE